jgi:hypothetical protein
MFDKRAEPRVNELGVSLLDRTNRLAADMAHNNAQIDALASKMAWGGLITGISILAAAIIIGAAKL